MGREAHGDDLEILGDVVDGQDGGRVTQIDYLGPLGTCRPESGSSE